MDVVVDSIPGTWSERRPKKYAPISVCTYPNSRNLRGLNIYFQGQGVCYGAVCSKLLKKLAGNDVRYYKEEY